MTAGFSHIGWFCIVFNRVKWARVSVPSRITALCDMFVLIFDGEMPLILKDFQVRYCGHVKNKGGFLMRSSVAIDLVLMVLGKLRCRMLISQIYR